MSMNFNDRFRYTDNLLTNLWRDAVVNNKLLWDYAYINALMEYTLRELYDCVDVTYMEHFNVISTFKNDVNNDEVVEILDDLYKQLGLV